MDEQIQKGEHSEEENQWVFDEKSYITDEGIDLDMDKVEKVMKPQPGARFNGDVRDKTFVPVGFRGQEIPKEKDMAKPNVEFKDPGIHKKSIKKTKSFLSKLEEKLFSIFKE